MSKVDPEVRDRRMSVTSIVSRTHSVGPEHARESWGGAMEFILSCIGYAVGLGNLTRFPYIAGRNGGASFMVPYFTMMVFTGLPQFYLELAIGQWSKVSPNQLYERMVPIWSGLGKAMLLISFYTAMYYNVYMAWALHYLWDTIYGAIANGYLPYEGCHKGFTEYCMDTDVYQNCYGFCPGPLCPDNSSYDAEIAYAESNVYYSGVDTDKVYPYGKLYDNTTAHCYNGRELVANGTWNQTDLDKFVQLSNSMYYNFTGRPPTTEYNDYMLGHPAFETEALQVWGWPKWDLLLSLFIAWLIIFAVLSKGIQSAGKVVYFTATAPYVLLIILCVIGNMLPGSEEGLKFYVIPDWSKVLQVQPWSDAASQIFFSLSVGGGGLTTLATYNEFHTNLLRDTQIVVFGNCLTSVFCGFVIFPILGFQAARVYPYLFATGQQQTAVLDVADGGPSLAFTSYPAALVTVTPNWLWCSLFWLMIVLLGIDSENVMVEVVITAIVDRFPQLKKNWKIKMATTATVCTVMFLGGIVFMTPDGIELVNLFDTFAGGMSLLIACLIESICVAYFYGIRRFIADIDCMMGRPPNALWRACGYPSNIYWWACWCCITPLILVFIIAVSVLDYSLSYNGIPYPTWGQDFGFFLAFSPAALIFIWMIPILVKMSKMGKPASWLLKSQLNWGPPDRKTQEIILAEHPYYNGIRDVNGFTEEDLYAPRDTQFGQSMANAAYSKFVDPVQVMSYKHIEDID